MTRRVKKILHELFQAGVALKAINSVWETIVGLLLLTHYPWVAHHMARTKSSQLLSDSEMAAFTYSHLTNLSSDSTRIFVSSYLLFHGIMNAFLAYNLYKERLWAYPTTIVLLTLFFCYQLYRLTLTHSLLLLLVTLFDAAFIALTWIEWRRKKRG